MTDKFVVSTNTVGEIIVTDAESGNVYHYGSMSNFLGLIRLLNEQQATINELKEENKELREEWEFSFRTEMAHHRFAEKELQEKIREKQATISRLEEENDNMNLFIKQTIEPLLFNCVFELDTIESMSQVELSRKIEDEIIPFIQDFKYLKYESPEEEKQDKSE